MQLGESPAPSHVVAHLSDTHLLARGARQYGRIDPEEGLCLALERLRRLDPPPRALVFTGDLTDQGEESAYERLRELVSPVAAELDAVPVWVMGNHDDAALCERVLHGRKDARPGAPQDRVHDIDGLRIVVLDTSVPGYHHGALAPEQLRWLRDVLASPAQHGTLLAMHHPPIPTPLAQLSEIIGLHDQHHLAPVLRGTDVRAILGGHLHFSTHSTFAGIPVSVASASCYTLDTVPLARAVSGVDGHQAFTTVHVYADRVVHTVVPLTPAPEVSGADLGLLDAIAAMTPEQRRETFSRKDSEFNRAWEWHSDPLLAASRTDATTVGSPLVAGSSGAPGASR